MMRGAIARRDLKFSESLLRLPFLTLGLHRTAACKKQALPYTGQLFRTDFSAYLMVFFSRTFRGLPVCVPWPGPYEIQFNSEIAEHLGWLPATPLT
jgi:hypothetical protein